MVYDQVEQLTLEEARGLRRRISLASGLPRKANLTRHGTGPFAVVPDTYSPGAPGWTEHTSAIRKHPDRDEYAVLLDDEAAAQDGKVVRVEGRDETVDLSSKVRRTADWDIQPDDGFVARLIRNVR